MGVPTFFRWLVDRYPNVVVPARSPIQEQTCSTSDAGLEFDNLYLDMNGIIHPCFHPEDQVGVLLFFFSLCRNLIFILYLLHVQEPPTTFDEVFLSVFEYIDWLFKIVRPKKLLFMAIGEFSPKAFTFTCSCELHHLLQIHEIKIGIPFMISLCRWSGSKG